MEAVNKVLRDLPEDPLALRALAAVQILFKGQYDEGLENINRQLLIQPKQGPLLELKAIACGRLGRWNEAQAAFDELERTAGGPAGFLRPEDYASNRGVTLHALGREREARDFYERAIALAPDGVPLAKNNLASLLFADGSDIARALELAESAATLDPENPDNLDTYGEALLRNGSPNQAITQFEKAIKLTKSKPNPIHLVHLGQAYAAAGNRKEAVKAAQDALRLQPDLGEARKLLDRVVKPEER
jgi:tetratricopeptide (TPR) repeat protein